MNVPQPEQRSTGANLRGAALLVIDVQRGLFTRPVPIYQSEKLLENICLLMERARQARLPVVIVQHSNANLLPFESEGWQLHPAVCPQEGDLRIHKQHGSAFEKTGLKARLEPARIDTVVVAGLVTQACIRATCLDARRLGYRVVLAQDAHSNYHRQAAQIIQESQAELTAAGVELQPTAQIVTWLAAL